MARRIRFFGQKIGKIGRPIGDIALGAAERLPILAHTPHILMACHHPIAVADIASYHRALGDHRIENVEKLVVEARIVDIEIPKYVPAETLLQRRSEERRVGKECVRTCSSRWSTSH